jgi:hypothetical protein
MFCGATSATNWLRGGGRNDGCRSFLSLLNKLSSAAARDTSWLPPCLHRQECPRRRPLFPSFDGPNRPISLDICSASCHMHGHDHHFSSCPPPATWIFQRHWRTHNSRRTFPSLYLLRWRALLPASDGEIFPSSETRRQDVKDQKPDVA